MSEPRAPVPASTRPLDQPRHLSRERRAVSPAVSKTLEIGLVVLFVALTTTVLLGGVLPEYRTAAGDEVGERVLVRAASSVEVAVQADGGAVTVDRRVNLPPAIAGRAYRIEADGSALVLDHPDDAIGGRLALTLQPRVDRVEGTWQSGAETVVHVETRAGRLVVTLRNRGPA